ncbi:MAG: hypothetical protein PHO37_03845 [Kiritimatiellae bacterium]|nr:hypothetical protein [Kiritimatiellia bacterium]
MKIAVTENVTLVVCELDENESVLLSEIAKQKGVDVEKALMETFSIFLNRGVQTPSK